MMIDKQKLLDILTSEIESSTGCTDPGSVCLAVAVAAHTLGRRPVSYTHLRAHET